jgi:hypothetical protein
MNINNGLRKSSTLSINKCMQFDDLFQKLMEAPATAPVRTPSPVRTPAPARPTPAKPGRPSWLPDPGTKTRPKALMRDEENEDVGVDPSIEEHDKKVLRKRTERRRHFLK